MATIRELRLVKGNQRYIFRYPRGMEETLLKIFANYAADPERKEFDWFDAAVLSYQIDFAT